MIGRIVGEELGRPFILPHLDDPVVGYHGDQPVIPHLVYVIGGGENAGLDGGDRLGIVHLVAGVAESG